MDDLVGGLVSGSGTSTSLTSQLSFSLIFNLLWKIIFATFQKAGLYGELLEYGIDLTKYINTDVNVLNN